MNLEMEIMEPFKTSFFDCRVKKSVAFAGSVDGATDTMWFCPYGLSKMDAFTVVFWYKDKALST